MRASILVLSLLLVDGALYWGLRRLGIDRAELETRREGLSVRAEDHRAAGERSREVQALLEKTARSVGRVDRALDIAELRDRLLSAERGLDLDRFSLDFRPSQDSSRKREGGRVSASLGGSFDAVHDYLGRVERLRLPLAPESVAIRPDEFGRILLVIDWNGLWSEEDAAYDELSPAEIARLERWLLREPAPKPGRDFFSEREVTFEPSPAVRTAPPPEPAGSQPIGLEAPAIASTPELTGFVIARPELETDVNRRVLAALRFEGELRLLGVGDAIGGYRVEEIHARESVLLVDPESGERLKLFLE